MNQRPKAGGGGFCFLSSNSNPLSDAPKNAPFYCFCQILKNVLVSAAEAELIALFEKIMKGIIFRKTLIDMVHQQPPTPVAIENTTEVGIVHNTIKPVRSRKMDM